MNRARSWAWALALTLVACKARTPPPDVLVLGTSRAPHTLDPAFAGLSSEREVLRVMFRDLTVIDDDWAVIPDLAADLPTATTSSAGFTARWRLRPGLRWSDGAALGPEDVRFGWTVERDPDTQALNHEVAARVRAITPRGPEAFDVVWGEPYADFAAPRVHAILPEHAYPRPEEGRPFLGMRAEPVGSGPFRLAERVPGEHLVFEANPHWAGPEPGLDRIVFRIFPSEDGFEAALATGAIHALGEASGLTPDRVAALRDRLADTHEVVTRPGGVLLHLDVRHDHPALRRVDVRRALLAAVDRAGLAEVTYDGLADPAHGLFPPRHPGHDPALPSVSHDPKGARRVLGALPPEQRRLTLGIGAGSGAAARAGAFLKAAFEAAGLEIRLEVAPMGVLFERMRAGEHPPLVLYAWRVRPDWDGASVVGTGGRQNYGGYSDPALDARLEALARTLEPAARRRALRAVEARFRARLPALPLLFRRTVSVRPRALVGWRPTGTVTPVTWSAEGWRWAR